jgi:hypothetical protein
MAMRFDAGRLRAPAVGTGTVLKKGYQPTGIQNAQLQPAPTGTGTVLKQAAPQAAGSGGSAQRGGGGGGGGGGGSFGGGGGGIVAPMVAPAPAMSEQDYLNSDDVYLAALSRYNKNFEDLEADIKRREGDYNTTYGNSLDDLGYLAPKDGGAAGWDFQNQQTAAGRGYQALIQDFAARGLLHSGDYLGAQNDFVGSLDSMNLAKQQFGEGLNQERTTGRSSRDAGVGQARAEALARMQQLYGAV